MPISYKIEHLKDSALKHAGYHIIWPCSYIRYVCIPLEGKFYAYITLLLLFSNSIEKSS